MITIVTDTKNIITIITLATIERSTGIISKTARTFVTSAHCCGHMSFMSSKLCVFLNRVNLKECIRYFHTAAILVIVPIEKHKPTPKLSGSWSLGAYPVGQSIVAVDSVMQLPL